MSKPILDSQVTFVKGEKRNLSINVFDQSNPNNDLSSSTATVTVYDSSNNIVLTSGSATVTGTTLITINRLWDTTSVVTGEYRAIFTVTYGSIIQIFMYKILVVPLPAP